MIMFFLTPHILALTPNVACYPNYIMSKEQLRTIYVRSLCTWLSELFALVLGWIYAHWRFKINAVSVYWTWLSNHPRAFLEFNATALHVMMDLFLAMVNQRFDIPP